MPTAYQNRSARWNVVPKTIRSSVPCADSAAGTAVSCANSIAQHSPRATAPATSGLARGATNTTIA